MIRPTLQGCFAKLERAEIQMQYVQNELREYVEGQPYKISDEPERTPHGWLLWRYHDVPVMPLRFGVILGEIVHDLRSALDHLVYQMVLRNKRKPYTGNCFPIYLIEDHPAAPCWVRRASSDLQGVRKRDWALFQRLQPFRRGHRALFHPLAILEELSVVDKHRVLYVAAMNAPYRVLPNVRMNTHGHSGFRSILRFKAGLIEEDAEAFRFGIYDAPYGSPPRVDIRVEPPVEVLFSDRALRVYDLQRIRFFIARSVFRRFAAVVRRDGPRPSSSVSGEAFRISDPGSTRDGLPTGSPRRDTSRVWRMARMVRCGEVFQS